MQVALLALALVVACVDEEAPNSPAPTGSATPLASPTARPATATATVAPAVPSPPPTHPLSTRTGIAALDDILAVIEARDGGALAARFDPLEFACTSLGRPLDVCTLDQRGFIVRDALRGFFDIDCGQTARRTIGPVPVVGWAVQPAVSLHSIAVVPAGYQPPADYFLTLLVPMSGGDRWELHSLLVRDGRVVATGPCGSRFQAPPRYLVAPAPLGDPNGSVGTTGLRHLDAIINAVRSRDVPALMALTDFERTPCEPGYPKCGVNEPSGTEVDAVWVVDGSCEGLRFDRRSVEERYRRILSAPVERVLLAAVERPRFGTPVTAVRQDQIYELVFSASLRLEATPRGVSFVMTPSPACSGNALGYSFNGAPEWILPPVAVPTATPVPR